MNIIWYIVAIAIASPSASRGGRGQYDVPCMFQVVILAIPKVESTPFKKMEVNSFCPPTHEFRNCWDG